MSLKLRPYQEKAIEQIKSLYMQKIRRVLLHLATGGGKTLVFCTILKKVNLKGTKAIVVVSGIKLIKQASNRLKKEGVEHGVIQGNNSRGSHHLIQVCSIDTLYRRKFAPEADFIVIDEAHQTARPAYEWLLSQYATAKILAVSATPHLKRGMRHVADAIVYPISVRELISQGYLAKARYFAPHVPDLSKVTTNKGEFDEEELSHTMQESAITGKPEEHYLRIAPGRRAIMFAVNVEHSHALCARFEAVGVKTAHMDAKTSDEDREKIQAQLESGEIQVISNVGILHTGFDCPVLSCVMLCRPTKSYNLHIQMIGRGTRTHSESGKQDFIVLDHAGNIERHGFIEDEQPCELDGMRRMPAPRPCKRCKVCYAVNVLTARTCEQCNSPFEIAPVERSVNEVEGELVEMENTLEEWQLELDRLIWTAREKGLQKGWVYYNIKNRYGDAIAEKAWNKIRVMKAWETKAKNTAF